MHEALLRLSVWSGSEGWELSGALFAPPAGAGRIANPKFYNELCLSDSAAWLSTHGPPKLWRATRYRVLRSIYGLTEGLGGV